MPIHGPEHRRALARLAMLLPCLALGIGAEVQAAKAFSLSGALGLQYEDYSYSGLGSDVHRTHWEKSMDLNAKGFVWDPRFLSYGAAVTLIDSDVDSSQADSGQDYLGYQLSTTWFGHRRNPFSLYAKRSADTVSNEALPSYTLDTRSLGARWGLDSTLLGRLNFNYDSQHAHTDNSLAARDEQSQQFNLEGRRDFLGDPEDPAQSNLSYGYRFNESDERISHTEHRQHYFYAFDRSVLSEKTHLSLNTSYYQREDRWQDPLTLSGSDEPLASSFFSLSSALTHNTSKDLSQHYNLAISRNSFDSGDTDTYNLSGGFNAIVNPRWSTHGSLGLKDTRVITTATENERTLDTTLQSGVRYQEALGEVHLNGGYTFAFNTPLSSTREDEVGLQSSHDASLGYSRHSNPLYQDSLNYRIKLVDGFDESREQNSRYAITSLLPNGDSLQASLDYRDYHQPDLDSWNARLDMSWNHRFDGYNTLNLSAGWSENGGQASDTTRQHLQLRLRWTPRRVRRLNLTTLARAESEHTAGLEAQTITTLEADANYAIGLWDTRARYRLRDLQGGLHALREQSIVLTFKRRLPSLL